MRRLHQAHSLALREAGRSADNLEPISLHRPHLPVEGRVKRGAAPIRTGDVPNRQRLHPPDLIRTPRAVRDSKPSVISAPRKLRVRQKPRLNADRDNRRVERKRERELQRRSHKSGFCFPFIVGRLCQTPNEFKIQRFTERSRGDASDIDGQLVRTSARGANESTALHHYSSSAICTAFSAAPLSN